jgi:hypothetical protein
MSVALTLGLTHKCCDCGIALKKEEVAGAFVAGRLVDYANRETEYIDDEKPIEFCSGCLGRIKEHRAKDQGDAILKRKELERDGPGPLKPLVFPEPGEIEDFRAPDGTCNGM